MKQRSSRQIETNSPVYQYTVHCTNYNVQRTKYQEWRSGKQSKVFVETLPDAAKADPATGCRSAAAYGVVVME